MGVFLLTFNHQQSKLNDKVISLWLGVDLLVYCRQCGISRIPNFWISIFPEYLDFQLFWKTQKFDISRNPDIWNCQKSRHILITNVTFGNDICSFTSIITSSSLPGRHTCFFGFFSLSLIYASNFWNCMQVHLYTMPMPYIYIHTNNMSRKFTDLVPQLFDSSNYSTSPNVTALA